MSLINDALKKAQKMRTDETASVPGAAGGESRVAKHGRPMSAQTFVLIAAGAAVLIIVAVVATIFFLRPPSIPPVVSPQSTASAPPSAPIVVSPPPTSSPSSSNITGAPASPAAPAPEVAKTGEIKLPESTGVTAPRETPPAKIELAPAATALESPTQAPVPKIDAKPDPRIQSYVDALRIMGVRSSGADSKVLMNDRVFRVNDIVDRTLGLRLTVVEPASLTFVDENGAVYLKQL